MSRLYGFYRLQNCAHVRGGASLIFTHDEVMEMVGNGKGELFNTLVLKAPEVKMGSCRGSVNPDGFVPQGADRFIALDGTHIIY